MAVNFAVKFQAATTDFAVNLVQQDACFDVEFGIYTAIDFPNYEGTYEVTPSTTEQVLETKDRSMRDNITVDAIPFYEVSNLYGGKTIIIGG